MPWRETRVMEERARFVVAVEAGEEPVAAVCRPFGISRNKGYKWLRRWQAKGAAGLTDRSRAPRNLLSLCFVKATKTVYIRIPYAFHTASIG
jgi:putative transposase